MGASQSLCPSPWFGMAASHSVQVLFFITKKSLSHSGRFGVGATKHERKVFLYPGIGGEGGGSSLYSLWVVCQIVKWKTAIWSDHCKRVGILHDKLWLRIWPCYQLPPPPPPEILLLYPLFPQWNYECNFLAQIPTSILVPCPDFWFIKWPQNSGQLAPK